MSTVVKVRYRDLAEYQIADDLEKEFFFAFGVRKSGSSIFNNILHSIARMNEINYVDVAGVLFGNGLNTRQWQDDPELAAILRPGNLYGGFRNFPTGLLGDERFKTSRKVLLVRDPRDALVSEYFSNAYSHSLPKSGESRESMLHLRKNALSSSIDEYVLRMAPAFKRTLREYTALPNDATLKIFKYEEVIIQKRKWIDEVCGFFGWLISEQQTGQILGWADVLPTQERPTEFVRKVTPGDHLEKLLPATISRLNSILDEEMGYYGYR